MPNVPPGAPPAAGNSVRRHITQAWHALRLRAAALRLLSAERAHDDHAAHPQRNDPADDLRALQAALHALLPEDGAVERMPPDVRQLVDSVRGALDTLVHACEANRQAVLAAGFRGDDDGDQDGHHHHHHDGGTARLLRKFIGTSDFDESMHVAVQLKAGLSALTEDKSDAGGSRLQAFQLGAVPDSGGDLAADVALSGLLGGAGTLALLAGRSERHEAAHEKKTKKKLHAELVSQLDMIERERARRGGEDGARSTSLLKRQQRIVEWKLARVNFQLRHVGKQRELGRGSEVAGYAMVCKALIDLCSKVAGHLDSGAAMAAGGASGFASIPLSPVAAGAGLYMGWNARRFTSAQLADYRAQLEAGRKKLEPLLGQLPAREREVFERFFEGKWKSHGAMLHSFKRLLGIFAGGMAGYTATIGGLSMVDIVTLAAGSAAVADLTLSGGVVTASTAVLIGTYGFLKHHARFHEYDEWMGARDGEVDLELMAELAAGGGQKMLELNLDTLSFLEDKEARRQGLLHELAWSGHKLRFDGLRTHSTDSGPARQAVEERQAASGTASGRRRAGLTLRNLKALGKASGSLLKGGVQDAKRSYGDSADYLTRTRLAALLSAPATAAPLRAHMVEDLRAQIALLERMLVERIAACGDAAKEVTTIDEHSSHLTTLRTGLLRAGTLQVRASELLGMLEGDAPVSSDVLARYLLLLKWDPALPDEAALGNAPRALAEYLMEGAPEQYRQSRLRLHRGQLAVAPLIEDPAAGGAAAVLEDAPVLPPIPRGLGEFTVPLDTN